MKDLIPILEILKKDHKPITIKKTTLATKIANIFMGAKRTDEEKWTKGGWINAAKDYIAKTPREANKSNLGSITPTEIAVARKIPTKSLKRI